MRLADVGSQASVALRSSSQIESGDIARHTLKAGRSLHTPTVLLAALFFACAAVCNPLVLLPTYSHSRSSFVPDTRNLLLPGMEDHWTLLLALLWLLDMLAWLQLRVLFVSCHAGLLGLLLSIDCLGGKAAKRQSIMLDCLHLAPIFHKVYQDGRNNTTTSARVRRQQQQWCTSPAVLSSCYVADSGTSAVKQQWQHQRWSFPTASTAC